MDTMMQVVKAFFEEHEWAYQEVPDQSALASHFRGENGEWTCYAVVDETLGHFRFYSKCAVAVAEAMRPAVAELLTRANYGLFMGNFEMDLDDGEVRFKTSAAGGDDQLTPSAISQMVLTNVVTMDRYLPGILAVSYGNRAPVEVIEEIEAADGPGEVLEEA